MFLHNNTDTVRKNVAIFLVLQVKYKEKTNEFEDKKKQCFWCFLKACCDIKIILNNKSY